nr:hypothetical protein [uncultured Undibacterium sp.]
MTAPALANSAGAQALTTLADTDPQATVLGVQTAGMNTDEKKYTN